MNRPLDRPRSAAVLASLLGSILVLLGVSAAQAQSTQQTFTLEPGWNAIHLRVQPDESAATPAQVFSIAGIASVWDWSPRESTLEFVQSPSELAADDPAWLRWIPADPLLTNLQFVRADRAYLVHYTGSAPAELTIVGRPVPSRIHWIPSSFHLTGLPVADAATQTFAEFFEGSEAHAAGLVYRLGEDRQSWEQVDPTTTAIESDRAYWIYSERGSDHQGSLEVRVPMGDRIKYGGSVVEQTVSIRNRSSLPKTVTLAAEGAAPGLLYVRNLDPAALAGQEWLPLDQAFVVPAGQSIVARLGIRRVGAAAGSYAAILNVSDAIGSRISFPVTATVDTMPSDLSGLWVGDVRIDAVSGVHAYQRSCQECSPLVDANGDPVDCPEKGQPAPPGEAHFGICLHPEGDPRAGLPIVTDPSVPLPVARPFSHRILVHVDAFGQARLLKEVIQMRRGEGSANPGEPVLLTNDLAIPFFAPIALRDSEFVGRRISTPAYDFEGASRSMSGTFGSELNVGIPVPGDLPTNPFLHRFHPDHNALDEQFQPETGLPSHLTEVPSVSRLLSLVFDPPDPDGLLSGYSEWGGRLFEEVAGLHKNTIVSTGIFTLKRVSFVAELDPAQ